MTLCRACALPIFEDWHCMVVTQNGLTYHHFCFYDEACVVSVRRTPRSPRIHLRK